MASPLSPYKTDPLLTGATIAGQKYKSRSELPKSQDYNAELFSDVRKSLGEKPRGWRALAAGFTRGLEHGSKLSSLEDRKEDLEKYERVMDYFAQTSQEALKRKEWYEKRDQAKTEVLPQVLSYIQNFSQYDPITREKVFDMALDQYNQMAGTDYKLQFIDGSNPLNAVVKNGEKAVPFNILNAFGDDESLRKEAAMQMPSYQMKLQEERKQREFENNLKQRQVGIQQQYLDMEKQKQDVGNNQNMGAINNALSDPQRKALMAERDSLSAAEDEYKTLQAAKNLLNKGEPLYGPIAQAVSALFGDIPDIAKSPDQASFEAHKSNLTGKHFRKMGYRNETEYKGIRTINPKLGKEQNLKIIEDMEKDILPAVERKKQLDAILNNNLGTNEQTQFSQPNQIVPEMNQGNANQSQEGMIAIRDPETGEIVERPASFRDKALELGWEIMQ